VTFCGYHTNLTTGLNEIRNRIYDPLTGTWHQVEPGRVYRDGYNFYEARFVPNRTDPNGLTVGDVVDKLRGRPVKKAYGFNAGGIAQLKIWGIPGVQAGANTVVMFFADTCEIAAYSAATGLGKELRDNTLPSLVSGKPKMPDLKNSTGKPEEGGFNLGVALTVEMAAMSGPGPASAASYTGDFHTLQGSGIVPVGDIPVPVAAGVFYGDKVGGRRWWGGNIGFGAGPSPLPANIQAGTVVWNYVLFGAPLDLTRYTGGKCACNALIANMPQLPALP